MLIIYIAFAQISFAILLNYKMARVISVSYDGLVVSIADTGPGLRTVGKFV